jgi:hypothetical protein
MVRDRERRVFWAPYGKSWSPNATVGSTIINHICTLCDLPDDSIMVRYMEQQR